MYQNIKRHIRTSALNGIFIIASFSCKKFIEVEQPPTSVTGGYVFSSGVNATSAILGIYSRIMQSTSSISGGAAGIGFYSGLCSDEYINYSVVTNQIEFYTNSISEANPIVVSRWAELYKVIYDVNSIIEGVSASPFIDDKLKVTLLAEAKFMRSYCYFYLVSLFGDIPLLLSSDYRNNSSIGRTPREIIYQRIILDLTDAISKLDDNYYGADNTITTERVRPNRWAAVALLSRVYLYNDDWKNAELLSTSIIEKRQIYDTTSLVSVFAKNSKETILQLQPVAPGVNTFDALCYVLTGSPSSSSSNQSTTISTGLINSFEEGDARRSKWIGNKVVGNSTYFFPFKYKEYISGRPVTEYITLLRLSEQYLIRAEARIHQGKIEEAIDDLNLLRKRARELPSLATPSPLPALSVALTKDEALLAVENERRHELFSESGHRWFDLIRTGRADAVLSPIKGATWQPTDKYWPIPQSEISLNSNLKPQNPGY